VGKRLGPNVEKPAAPSRSPESVPSLLLFEARRKKRGEKMEKIENGLKLVGKLDRVPATFYELPTTLSRGS